MRPALAALLLVAPLVACGAKPAIRPSTRYATGAAVVGGTVYVVGGIERTSSGDTTIGTTEAYSPGEGKWTRCAPMPTPRSFAAVAALDGKVYVFGGLDAAGRALDTAEVFDPGADSWSALPGMGMARSRLAAVNHMDHSLVVGGGLDGNEENSARVRVFIPREGRWSGWCDLNGPRHGFGMVDAADGSERVFAVGGYDATGPLASVSMFGVGVVKALDESGRPKWPGATSTDGRTGEVTRLDRDYMGYEWRPQPPLQEARGFFGLAAVGRRLYAVGGRCPTIPRTEALDMDDPGAGWRPCAPLPKDLCRFSMVAWNGRLLAFGGETGFGKAVNTDVLEYDPAADKWSVR